MSILMGLNTSKQGYRIFVMKNLHVIKREELNLVKELKEFEGSYSAGFPDKFRDFLLLQNPDLIEENCFLKEEDEFEIHHFIPLSKYNKYSIQNVNENLRDFFCGQYVVFAADSGGWKFAISVGDTNHGKVFFCRMDEDLIDALTLLADTFEEFIDGMFINEDWK